MKSKASAALFVCSIAILTQLTLAQASAQAGAQAGDQIGEATRLDSLEEQAATLQQLSADAQAKGHSTQEARRILNDVTANFSADELKQIKEQGDGALPAEKQKLWAQLKSRYLEIENSQDHLIENFDKTASAEIDFLTDYGVSVVADAHQEIRPSLKSKEAKRLDELYEALKTRYDEYLGSKKYLGTKLDSVRKKNLDSAVLAFRAYYDELERLAGPKQTLGQQVSEKIRNTLGTLKSIFEKLKLLASMLPDAAGLVKSVFLPSSKVEPGKLEFTKSLYQTVKTYTKAQGIQVDIQGRENIPMGTPPDGKVLNIFTPSHRHTMNDLVLMTHYTPEDTMVVAAFERFLPKSLVGPVSKNPATGAVTKKGGAIKAMVEKLKLNSTRNLVIYPEGGIPAAIEESTPIQRPFSAGLLETFTKEGYELRLVPVTYLDSARFLNRVDISQKDIKLTARVSEPIEPHTYLAMRAIGKDDQSVSRFLRSTWFENFPTDSNRVMGLLRPKVALTETDALLTQGKGAKSPCYPSLTKALQELK